LPVTEDFTPVLPLSDKPPLVGPFDRYGGGCGGEEDLDAPPAVDFTALQEDEEVVVVVDRRVAAPAEATAELTDVELAGIFEARSRFLADMD
jgi:hypothetical protein